MMPQPLKCIANTKKEDMEYLFYLVNEKGMSIRAAAKKMNIPQRWLGTGTKKVKKHWKTFFERRKPGSGRPVCRPPKLTEAHRDYVVKLVDENDTGLPLDQMMENLAAEFMGLQIFKSAFHEFSKVGARAIVKIPKTKSKMTTILGAVSSYDVVNMKCVRTPKVVQSKKKLEGSKADKRDTDNIKRTIDTVTGPYFNFIASTLDVMNRHEDIKLYVESRVYSYVHLLPYSPELNPIEQFWSIYKNKLKRETL
ncbi:hypothetical protein G6F56_003526 [Rhizopus delemar]|nr:hypothetical protein G6F56_003526 [Rhizopus delemar]